MQVNGEFSTVSSKQLNLTTDLPQDMALQRYQLHLGDENVVHFQSQVFESSDEEHTLLQQQIIALQTLQNTNFNEALG